MAVRVIGLIATIIALGYALASLAYLVWISATRLTPDQLKVARLYGAVWFGIAAACAAVSVWLVVSIVRRRSAAQRGRGFDLQQ